MSSAEDLLPVRPYQLLAGIGTVTGLILLLVIPSIFGVLIRFWRNEQYTVVDSWYDGFQFCIALYVLLIVLACLWYVIHKYAAIVKQHCIAYRNQNRRKCCNDCKSCLVRRYHRLRGDDDDSQQQESSTNSTGSTDSRDHFLPSEAYRT